MSVLNWGAGNYTATQSVGDDARYPDNCVAQIGAQNGIQRPQCDNPNGGIGGEGNQNMAGILRGEK